MRVSKQQCTKAYKELEQLCNQYGAKPAEELSTAATKAIDNARLTLVEYLLVQALSLVDTDEEKAIKSIQDQTPRLGSANLSSTDVHPFVWLSCQKVLKGESFK